MKIKILVSILGLVFIGGAVAQTMSFPDVKSDQWFYQYVMQIKDWGVVDGNDDGTFTPARNINRAEFSKMIVRYDARVDTKIEEAIEAIPATEIEIPEMKNLPSIIYLDRDDNQTPSNCPVNWEELSYGRIYENTSNMNRRVCMTEKSCRVLNFRSREAVPKECPTGWTEADYGETNTKEKQRTCFICLATK